MQKSLWIVATVIATLALLSNSFAASIGASERTSRVALPPSPGPQVGAERTLNALRSSRILMVWPSQLNAGQRATFSGTLQEYKNGWKGFSGYVTLEMRDKNGNVAFSNTMLSAGAGNFSFSLVPPGRKKDRLQVRVIFPGNFQHRPSTVSRTYTLK